MTALRLLKAARAGDEAEIEALIARGVKGTRKQLVDAARAGETHVVEVLLRSGTRGTRPQLAAAREAGESAVEEVLLRSGAASVEGRLLVALRRDDSAEIEALKREGALSQSALERAIEYDDVESARALLSVGVDPNTPHSKGVGPVHANARTPAMLAALVDGGADLNAPAPAGTFQWSTAAWLCRRAASAPPSHWSEEEKAHPLAMLKLALARGMDVSSDGAAHLEALAREARTRTNHRDGLRPEERRRIIDTIKALSAAGAKTSGALAIYLQRARYAPDPEIVEALDGDPARAPANAPAPPDSAAAFEAEKRAHPAPAAPASQPNGGFWAALTIAGGLALLLALVTCGARPAPAAEADLPGWRFVEAVDGDTLAFAVDAYMLARADGLPHEAALRHAGAEAEIKALIARGGATPQQALEWTLKEDDVEGAKTQWTF